MTTLLLRLFMFVFCALFHCGRAWEAHELDCRMRQFAWVYAGYLHSDEEILEHVHDALQLESLCPSQNSLRRRRKSMPMSPSSVGRQEQMVKDQDWWCERGRSCIYVLPEYTDLSSFASLPRQYVFDIHEAIRRSSSRTMVVLKGGMHSVTETIQLNVTNSGLKIVGHPNESVWLSGGVSIPRQLWKQHGKGMYVADLSQLLEGFQIPKIVSIFGTDKRLIRARFPNANPERNQWGYSSPHRLDYSIPADHVLEWHKPPASGELPQFTYVDLREPSRGRPTKNDSTMELYNVYAAGVGGVCGDVWGNESSYWCSNASAGGWAEVDREAATTGRLGIPVGMTYNTTGIGERLQKWGKDAIGAIVHAWHSQSWAMHMFEIESATRNEFTFKKGGGRQGGRNWCRCDQCTYAGGWCGQHHDDPTDDRLISGTWAVENLKPELDAPDEFFFDRETMQLYLIPNATSDDDGLTDLRFALTQTLVEVKGTKNIEISNLGFRDSTATYMGEWSVPSGGDWSLHRGGALFIEDASNVVVANCTFRRLDGNAVFLSRRTRDVVVKDNIFEWLGENAVSLWGHTDGFDATARDFPLGTLIQGNVMRELGIYQKQSSCVSHNKASQTTIQDNLMFNTPRAAINFNDLVGGGDVVRHNLIFNTCRESGDHGPINSWDRQPFMTDLQDGTPTFTSVRRSIEFNFIIANYGASQGVDNDDGSSFFHLHDNVFYNADGFKMDYGGHDSIYEDNLVIAYPHKETCIGFGNFLEGHGHIVRRNRCVVPKAAAAAVQLATCEDNNAVVHDNVYFAPDANITAKCGYGKDSSVTFKELQSFGIEKGSTVLETPESVETIWGWAADVLFSELQGDPTPNELELLTVA